MSKELLTNHFIMSALSVFANSMDTSKDWKPRTRYIEGESVRAGTAVYMALNTGVSSNARPVHTSGTSTDGSIRWAYVRTAIAPPGTLGSNLYLGLGRSYPWDNEPLADDITDPRAFLNDCVALLRLTRRNVAPSARRRDWETGVIPQWPSIDSYVNVGLKVYRCLSNNSGASSTVEPIGDALQPVELADGYIWKYMGEISNSLNSTFGTVDFFPVAPLTSDDGTDRWLVQEAARAGEISGWKDVVQVGTFTDPVVSIVGSGSGAAARADINLSGVITRIVSTALGENYRDATAIVSESGASGSGAIAEATLDGLGGILSITVDAQGSGYNGATVVIVGDGVGAEASVEEESGYIISITVDEAGSGYTWADIYVIPGEAGATASPVFSPVGGHGRDMAKELPVNALVVNRRISILDGKYVPSGQYRQVALVTAVLAETGNGDLLTGPSHPSASGLDKADIRSARVLQLTNIAAVEHNAGAESSREQDITTVLELNLWG